MPHSSQIRRYFKVNSPVLVDKTGEFTLKYEQVIVFSHTLIIKI